MRLNAREIRDGLDELLTIPGMNYQLIRETKEYIRQLEGDLRRAGFTEYNDPKDKETQQ
jgi:hypothetical protein